MIPHSLSKAFVGAKVSKLTQYRPTAVRSGTSCLQQNCDTTKRKTLTTPSNLLVYGLCLHDHQIKGGVSITKRSSLTIPKRLVSTNAPSHPSFITTRKSQKSVYIVDDLKNAFTLNSSMVEVNWLSKDLTIPEDVAALLQLPAVDKDSPIVTEVPFMGKSEWSSFFNFKEELKRGSKKLSVLETSSSQSDSPVSAGSLISSACAVKDYAFLKKVLKFVSDGRWRLLGNQDFHVIFKSLLSPDATRNNVDLAFEIFNKHLKTRPDYLSSHMRSLGFYFASRLAKSQLPKALELYRSLQTEFATVPSAPLTQFVEGLYWLDILALLPDFEMVQSHANFLKTQIGCLKNDTQRAVGLSQISQGLIRGLLTANRPYDASLLLQPGLLFKVDVPPCKPFFISSFVEVTSHLAKQGDVLSVSRLLHSLNISSHHQDLIPHHTRLELLLEAHSNGNVKERMSLQAAQELLDKFSRIHPVTTKAQNALLTLAARTSTLAQLQTMIKSTNPSFIPDAKTFTILLSKATLSSPEIILETFAEACSFGVVDASHFTIVFQKVFGKGIPTQLSYFRLHHLIEQFETSGFKWTSGCVAAIMAALNHHSKHEETQKFFFQHLELGQVSLDSECAYQAIIAAQNLAPAANGFLQSLYEDMHQTLQSLYRVERTQQKDTAPTPLKALLKPVRPAKYLKWKTGSPKLAGEERITSLKRFLPDMIPNSRIFELRSKFESHDHSFIELLLTEPYSITPTPQTYKNVIQNCIKQQRPASLVKLLNSMLELHPTEVNDEIVSNVLAALIVAGQLHYLPILQENLVSHNIRIPDPATLQKAMGAPEV